jgi:hypothetical protein
MEIVGFGVFTSVTMEITLLGYNTVVWREPGVSVEHFGYILKVKMYAKQETNRSRQQFKHSYVSLQPRRLYYLVAAMRISNPTYEGKFEIGNKQLERILKVHY